MASVSDIIQTAKVSQYLCTGEQSKGTLFNKREINPYLPFLIYRVRKSVQWMYDTDPSYSNLQQVANYLQYLCKEYYLTAQGIISGGGGSVSPITPIVPPAPYQFTVSASSFIATGESTKVITAFIGYNLIFIRGGVPQSTVDEGGTFYSWVSATGTFTCVGAANEGELFQLYAI